MPLACLFAPYPPAPLPRRGRGSPRLFHARGFAPCIPGVEPGRHRSRGANRALAGGCPALPTCLAAAVPSGGACLSCRLPTYPAFSLFFCPPIPPSPFPGGEGGDQSYFMQGASPLASPGLNPRGTGSTCRCRRLNGGVPPALLAYPLPPPSPTGGGAGAGK